MVASDTAGNVSPPTRPQAGVPIDERIPPSPYWIDQTWFIRNQSDNTLSVWPTTGIVPAGFSPALLIRWQSDTPTPSFSISRRLRGAQIWSAASTGPSGTYATQNPGAYSWRDDDAAPGSYYEYRVLVRSAAGVWSTDYRILATVRPPQPA
jgi:hypothetical protein